MTPFANIFQPLIDVFEWVLLRFHDDVGLGWGFSIIALTVTVRAALIPLTLKQFRSMQEMQRWAPQLKALQEKYKEDRQRQQQEIMKFYQEHKINPFASCLPLLAQLPVFLALFYLLQKDLRREICGQSAKPCGDILESGDHAAEFLFISDITDKATGGVLVTLILLYIGSQLLSSVLMTTSTMDPMQRRLLIALPFVFTFFIINFPAGLIVYWITTNLWTILQQYIVRRRVGPLKPLEPIGAVAAATAGGGSGGGKSSSGPTKAPPPPPRKKRKRSGRRR